MIPVRKSSLFLAIVLAALLAATLATVAAQAQETWMQPITKTRIEADTNATITLSGTAIVGGELRMSTSAYKMFKEIYNPLSVFVRQMNWGNTPAQLVDVKVEADDANNRVKLSYKRLGAAVYQGSGKWKVKLEDDDAEVKLVAQQGNKLVITITYAASQDLVMTETLHLALPSNAKNIVFDKEEKAIYYEAPLPGEKGGNRAGVAGGAALAGLGAAILLLPITRRRKEEEPELPPPPPTRP
ncbi:hypothetical protein PYJP_06600 [Pyrofollis japonicus]|uniref:hypothetical protein n=1 Tax=Pyrofollis japonicus TaxID=3060460 RepID=UPI00295B7FD0|nr:hypothetical protein [Pyrofollis japonicus]BEP17308.1 hypothetical protein PYJP_06600 [Pyrofollis japonicus]